MRAGKKLYFHILISLVLALLLTSCTPVTSPEELELGESFKVKDTPGITGTVDPPLIPKRTDTPEVLSAVPHPTQSPKRTAPSTPSPTSIPANPLVIGASVQGLPLEVYWFGSGQDQRLIVADIHGGNEWNTAALADELIAYLQEHPEVIPPDITLFILRSLNPDGEARAHGPDGRANANGVDLNRNFPINWQQNYRRSGCWQERPVTAGLAPASEPETQALMAFITAQPSIQAAISYHSAALGIFPGGTPPDPASIHLAESLSAVSGYSYPPLDTGCIYTGQLADWLSSQGIAAVDVELTNHRYTDFETNLKVLDAFLAFIPGEAVNSSLNASYPDD
jgi:hypothetical protein